MSIIPLPQFEADFKAQEEDRLAYERLSTPSTIVVRFGVMRLVGEFPYEGDQKPGCGSKIVVRTHRGVELGEMLTSTCPNAGCGKSVSRKEMLEYIEHSGGRDYPFFEKGKALRVATARDLAEQSSLDGETPAMVRFAQERARELDLAMKIVEAEPLLGGNRLTFYFTSEERIDFRDLVRELSKEYSTRIELRQVGARDEARLVADYERCGQHCCCRQFLKVLKPVSMRSAKTQKATLDPLKISGRCGRLMCCLRYEDETYRDLVKRLPKMRKRVGTPDGVGVVVDRQILTQLVLVRLEHDQKQVAVPVEELCDPDEAPKPGARDALRGMNAETVQKRTAGPSADDRATRQDRHRERGKEEEKREGDESSGGARGKSRRRRGRRGKPSGSRQQGDEGDGQGQKGATHEGRAPRQDSGGPAKEGGGQSPAGQGKKRSRRRRRRRKSTGEGGGEGRGEGRRDGGGGDTKGSGGGAPGSGD